MKEKGQQRANKLIYTKCDEYSDPSPIIRENFDLMSALKNVRKIIQEITLSRFQSLSLIDTIEKFDILKFLYFRSILNQFMAH